MDTLSDDNDELWKSKAIDEYGNLFDIYAILSNDAGLELTPDLKQKFGEEPSSWHDYYIQKNETIDIENEETRMDQADKEYAEARKQLDSFQQDGNITALQQVASRMMWILDTYPSHGGCYYILGFILFVLNKLDSALELLQMSRAVDPSFEPVGELEEEIQKIMGGYLGSNEGEALLLENEALSPALLGVLAEIFKSFDKDDDGTLCPEELDRFIFTTNGSHPPQPFLLQMGQRFGCNNKGWLTKDGFLAFYLEQTLDDPTETRNDLNVHGYDPDSLQKQMEE